MKGSYELFGVSIIRIQCIFMFLVFAVNAVNEKECKRMRVKSREKGLSKVYQSRKRAHWLVFPFGRFSMLVFSLFLYYLYLSLALCPDNDDVNAVENTIYVLYAVCMHVDVYLYMVQMLLFHTLWLLRCKWKRKFSQAADGEVEKWKTPLPSKNISETDVENETCTNLQHTTHSNNSIKDNDTYAHTSISNAQRTANPKRTRVWAGDGCWRAADEKGGYRNESEKQGDTFKRRRKDSPMITLFVSLLPFVQATFFCSCCLYILIKLSFSN